MRIAIGVARADAPLVERQEALDRWRTAIRLANGFVQSSDRHTLPAGRLAADALRFETDAGTSPVTISCSRSGNGVAS